MSQGATRICHKCGEEIARDDTSCPRCQAETTTDFLRESPAELSLQELLDSEDAADNPLYECEKCGRLVELKEHQGIPITPRFCPWCGDSVVSIIGRELDGYLIDGLLSRGGFGIVYRASNVTQPKMKAVVKILRPDLGYQRPELVRIFVEEARLTEEIGQTCFNVGQIRNVREKPWPCYLMEYVRGLTLDAAIDRAGEDKVPLDDCKGYLRGIAKALASTHAKGRVHRDLKPQNIMVLDRAKTSSAEEKIKLLDFGLAMKIAGAEAGISQTDHSATGLSSLLNEMDSPVVTAGTPDYMPPEAFDGINEFGGDIYAFGVTGFELLTSERPWKDPRADTDRFFYWRETHKTTLPRTVREFRSETPSWLSKVIMRCLEKNPKHRFESADELLESLREPVPRWVWGAAAAAVVVFGLFIWNVVNQALQKPPEREISEWRAIDTEDGVPTVIAPAASTPLGRGRTAKHWVSKLDAVAETIFLVKVPTGVSLSGFAFGAYVAPVGSELIKLDGVSFDTNEKDNNWLEIRFDAASAAESETYLSEDMVAVEVVGIGREKVLGRLEFHVDRDPPLIDRIRVVGGGPKPKVLIRLGTPPRVNHRKVRFQVDIEEPNMEAEDLTVSFGPNEAPLRLEPKHKSGDTWEFALGRLTLTMDEAGVCTLRISAQDKAGNQAAAKSVRFKPDSVVNLTTDAVPMTVAGNLFFEVTAAESVTIKNVYNQDGEEDVPFNLYPFRSGHGWCELARALESPEDFPPLDASKSLKKGTYYLAVPVKRAGKDLVAPGEKLELVVDVEDRALPPNPEVRQLIWDRPRSSTPTDLIEKLTFVLGENIPKRILIKQDLWDALLAKPLMLGGGRINEIRIKCKENARVYRARIKGKEDYEETACPETHDFVFATDLPVTQKATRLSLHLVDGAGSLATADLSIQRDSREPDVEVSLDKPNQTRLASWDEVSLKLESKEALAEAKVQFERGETFPGTYDGGRDIWSFKNARPDALKSGGGNYRLRFTAKDPAGNETVLRRPLVVNAEPPTITKTIPEPVNNVLSLNSRLTLVITDANGIDHEKAVVELHVSDEATPRLARLEHWSKESYTIDFDFLKKNCEGTLTVKVPDIDAKFVEQWNLGKAWLRRSRLFAREKWSFEFTKPTVEWKSEVEFGGLVFVKVGVQSYYVSKFEVPNHVFRRFVAKHPQFAPPTWSTKNGKHFYPKYYSFRSGKLVTGKNFPVVDIDSAAAIACAKELFAGRLPTRSEWEEAARLGSLAENPPWRLHEGKSYWHTHWEDWDRESEHSPYIKTHYAYGSEKGARAPVPVHFDAIDDVAEKKIKYANTFFHIIGNVGEIVWKGKDEKDEDEFSVAGGDYDTYFKSFRENADVPFERYGGPGIYTGFRILIHLDELTSDTTKTAKAFLEAAKK